jgi:DhnA family fructose-bisphosphate aldolase class Ia
MTQEFAKTFIIGQQGEISYCSFLRKNQKKLAFFFIFVLTSFLKKKQFPIIDLTRYQVVNCYMGRSGLINSGGASGSNDLAEAVRTAVINKRVGGMGLISGRKAFQKPMAEGIKLLNAIQDVYLSKEVTVA